MQPAMPSTSTLLQRGMYNGLRDAWRSRSSRTMLIACTVMLLLIQLLLLAAAGTQGIHAVLATTADIRIPIRIGTSMQDAQTFFALLQQEPYVADAVYSTREQALEQARVHDPNLIALLEASGRENPFHDTVGIRLRSMEDHATLRSFVEQPQWQAMIDPATLSEMTDQQQSTMALASSVHAGRSIAFLALALAMGALLMLTIALWSKHARIHADETLVRTLAGATDVSLITSFASSAASILLVAYIGSVIFGLPLAFVLVRLVPALHNGALGSAIQNSLPSIQFLVGNGIVLEVVALLLFAVCAGWVAVRRESPLLIAR